MSWISNLDQRRDKAPLGAFCIYGAVVLAVTIKNAPQSGAFWQEGLIRQPGSWPRIPS